MESPLHDSRSQGTSSEREEPSVSHRRLSNVSSSAIPKFSSRLGTNRLTRTQPTYDFITGTSNSPPPQPLRQTFRQSSAIKPDIGNEDLRAHLKKLQYELEKFKEEREVTSIRHENELRNSQVRLDAEIKRAQTAEHSRQAAVRKYESLDGEFKELQDQFFTHNRELEKRLRSLQVQNSDLEEYGEEARTDLATQERQHQHQFEEVEKKHAVLERTLVDLREELEAKATMLQTTHESLLRRDAEVGTLESEVLQLKAQASDIETTEVIKRELSEQVAHIRKLESTNREQSAELKHLRRVHKAVEVVEEEKRRLESKVGLMDGLRRELGEAQLQRQRLEDERKSWASYLQNEGIDTDGDREFDSPEALARALVRERLEKASLMEKLGSVQPEALEKDEVIRNLEFQKSKLQTELEALRASGGSGSGGDSRVRARLERQRALAVKEVEYLREQLRTFDSEETTYQPENHFDEQKNKRIGDLEAMVDQYRQELSTVNEELLSKRESSTEPKSLKRPREDEVSDEYVGHLSRKNRKLQDDLSILQQNSTMTRKELEAMRTQLSSLQASARTRVLELRSNPTADAEALKLNTLSALREENKALLVQLQGQTPATKVVPVSTLDNVRGEVNEMEKLVAEKEKRMLRLKQIWASKSLEFREAVASLLGWKMDFMPNGRFRMTSIFHPGEQDGDDDGGGNSLVFDGETGTMKISAGPQSEFAHEIRGLIRFWVEERKEIPAFLAACTLEFYEKTTRANRM